MNSEAAQLLLTSAKGCLVFASVAVAIYIVAGSWMFPDWWYGFLWDRKRSLRDIREALTWLLDQRITLIIAMAFVFFVSVEVGVTLQRQLLWVTDRFGWRILFAAVMAITIDALAIYQAQKGPYARLRAA